ncbi:uncharacterized protein BBA_06692 [Beauveria bassiana ARSEF 2860]|uniref:Methyltransferase domain-containing protein n=1 Tax=Beauveria bassiana (strain ARSEF 2860) TaxID=655819 RepID=J4W1F8_BEAB2|nr:uncharacterized protein BBA_06692 [Beauveria bassiana ARSEF 2860]EJP64310.1 hypothetical protein BBA_06692 [Beauveria bassiana ARSEF 2860]
MPPTKPLPCSDEFATPEEYVEELLDFASTSDTWQILCGAVHVVDFFITEPGLFYAALPAEWHAFLLSQDVMRLLDFFVRDNPDTATFADGQTPPASLTKYIKTIRRLALRRDVKTPAADLPPLTRTVSVGMNPKKVHEVRRFADYVTRLSSDMAAGAGDEEEVTHFVDFGSGQNYLGRALASEPYNRRVVAVEGRQKNVDAAKSFDTQSGLAVKPKILRNKKVWNKILEVAGPNKSDPEALAAAIKEVVSDDDEGDNFRKIGSDELSYTVEEGKGLLQYVSGRLDNGDLSEVIAKIDRAGSGANVEEKKKRLKLMAVSIHSCGNLSHYGIRSLVLNPDIHAVAIVGCCYNLVTEKLGPPTHKQHGNYYLRPTLQAVNGRVIKESDRRDPQGFPMSERLSTYRGHGIRANITARMMACQAPQNWTAADSELFFTRHFYRAVLQKIFLDRGAVHEVLFHHPDDNNNNNNNEQEDVDPASLGPFQKSTSPLAIGTLPKRSYGGGLAQYIRAAVNKLTTSSDYKKYAEVMRETMADMSEAEMEAYMARFAPRKKELCIVWSLMAYSATLVEALMVTDRWVWLKEQQEVGEAWVETVFDFGQSPRNMVVVGIKKESGGGGGGSGGGEREADGKEDGV